MPPVDSSQSRVQGSFVIICLFLSTSASEEILFFRRRAVKEQLACFQTCGLNVCVFLNSAKVFKAWKKINKKALFLLTLLPVKYPQKWKHSNNSTALTAPPTSGYSMWWKNSLELQADKNCLSMTSSFALAMISILPMLKTLLGSCFQCWRPNPESSAFLANVIPLS